MTSLPLKAKLNFSGSSSKEQYKFDEECYGMNIYNIQLAIAERRASNTKKNSFVDVNEPDFILQNNPSDFRMTMTDVSKGSLSEVHNPVVTPDA